MTTYILFGSHGEKITEQILTCRDEIVKAIQDSESYINATINRIVVSFKKGTVRVYSKENVYTSMDVFQLKEVDLEQLERLKQGLEIIQKASFLFPPDRHQIHNHVKDLEALLTCDDLESNLYQWNELSRSRKEFRKVTGRAWVSKLTKKQIFASNAIVAIWSMLYFGQYKDANSPALHNAKCWIERINKL